MSLSRIRIRIRVRSAGIYCYTDAVSCSAGPNSWRALPTNPPLPTQCPTPPTPTSHNTRTSMPQQPHPDSLPPPPAHPPTRSNGANPCQLDFTSCSTGVSGNLRNVPGSPAYAFVCPTDFPDGSVTNGAGGLCYLTATQARKKRSAGVFMPALPVIACGRWCKFLPLFFAAHHRFFSPPPRPQCLNGPNLCGPDHPCVFDYSTCSTGVARRGAPPPLQPPSPLVVWRLLPPAACVACLPGPAPSVSGQPSHGWLPCLFHTLRIGSQSPSQTAIAGWRDPQQLLL